MSTGKKEDVPVQKITPAVPVTDHRFHGKKSLRNVQVKIMAGFVDVYGGLWAIMHMI